MTPLDSLLETTWPGRGRAIRGRELAIALGVSGVFLAVAIPLAATAGIADGWHAAAAAVVLAHVLAARIEFPIGAAIFTPTQLFLVPLFVVAPAGAVPLLVFAAFASGAIVAAARGRARIDRLAFSASDSVHALGPAIVLTAFAGGDGATAGPAVIALAFAAQFWADLVASSIHELVSMGARAKVHAQLLLQVWAVDLALGAVGLMTAVIAVDTPWAALTPLPLALLLRAIADDRSRKVGAAQERLIALEQERGRRQAAAQLVERQNQFLQDVSHELRTPVTIASGHLENLARSGQYTTQTHVALDELRRIERMVERLLVLARTGEPGFSLTERVDAETLLEDRFVRWSDTIPRAWQLGDLASGTVLADCDSLRAALDALLENAVKYTTPSQTIRLSSRVEKTGLAIEVADHGTGIPIDAMDRIFDRFARGDSSRNRHLGGHGLGLALVHAVANAHSGSCEVASSASGSTFTLLIGSFESAHVSRSPRAAPAPAVRKSVPAEER